MSEYKNYQRLVEDYFGSVNNYKDEIGLEIEVEGRNLPNGIPSYWSVHPDGSLRNGGLEYVLQRPTTRQNVYKYLQYLEKKIAAAPKVDVVLSPRTSVHVHLSAKDQTILEVYNNLCLYFIFEDLLTHYAGPTRVGNLFCLRAKDSDFFVKRLAECAERDDYRAFWDEAHLRYTAVNVCALQKFNSLEYRAMRGTIDAEVITEWVSILLCIKDKAKEYLIPPDIIKDFSTLGTKRFTQKILGAYAEKFLYNNELDKFLWEGVRIAQDIAYARMWEHKASRPIPRTFGKSVVLTELAGPATTRNGLSGRNLAFNSFESLNLAPVTYDSYPGRTVGVEVPIRFGSGETFEQASVRFGHLPPPQDGFDIEVDDSREIQERLRSEEAAAEDDADQARRQSEIRRSIENNRLRRLLNT